MSTPSSTQTGTLGSFLTEKMGEEEIRDDYDLELMDLDLSNTAPRTEKQHKEREAFRNGEGEGQSLKEKASKGKEDESVCSALNEFCTFNFLDERLLLPIFCHSPIVARAASSQSCSTRKTPVSRRFSFPLQDPLTESPWMQSAHLKFSPNSAFRSLWTHEFALNTETSYPRALGLLAQHPGTSGATNGIRKKITFEKQSNKARASASPSRPTSVATPCNGQERFFGSIESSAVRGKSLRTLRRLSDKMAKDSPNPSLCEDEIATSASASSASQDQEKADEKQSSNERKEAANSLMLVSKQVVTGTEKKNRTQPPPVCQDPAPRPFSHWTPEEDQLLLFAIEQEGGPPVAWKLICKKYFKGRRNANQCKARWKNHLNPKLKHTPWTTEEDDLLIAQRKKGLSWVQIASQLSGRNTEQVRDRFNNFLDPTLNREPFTEQELSVLYDAQRELGNKWTAIAAMLPGRSENMVKNCWHNARMSQRRKLSRLGGTAMPQGKRRKKNPAETSTTTSQNDATALPASNLEEKMLPFDSPFQKAEV